MWRISDLQFRKTTLNFSSSGQGLFEATQLIADDVMIANAIELIDWADDEIQLTVCDACGTLGCNSGNWVVLRHCGEYILMIPAFSQMGMDPWNRDQYGPPYFIQNTGTPFFDFPAYESLKIKIPSLPKIETIKPLKISEAVRLTQYTIPRQILGVPPVVEINRDAAREIFAASVGEPEEHLAKILELIKRDYDNDFPAALRNISVEEKPVMLFIDTQKMIPWEAMVRSSAEQGCEYKLLFENTLVIEETKS